MTRQQALPVGVVLVVVVLAGCLVCSAAVGMATVMVMTLNGLLL